MRQTFLFLLLVLATSCWAKADMQVETGVGCDFPGEHRISSYSHVEKCDSDAGYNGYAECTGSLGSVFRLGLGAEMQSKRSYRLPEDKTQTFRIFVYYFCLNCQPRLSESLRIALALHFGWNDFKTYDYYTGADNGTTYYACGIGLSHMSGISVMFLARRHNVYSGASGECMSARQNNLTLRLGYRFNTSDLINPHRMKLNSQRSFISKICLQCFLGYSRLGVHQLEHNQASYHETVEYGFIASFELLRLVSDRLKAGVGVEFQDGFTIGQKLGKSLDYHFVPMYACAVYTILTKLRVSLETIAHIGYADFDVSHGYRSYYSLLGEPKGGFYGGLGIGVTDKSGLTVNVMYRVNYGSIDYDNGWSNGTARITQNQFVIRFGYRL